MEEMSIFATAQSTEPMVKVHFDGTIEFGPDYDPDLASELFWQSVGAFRKAQVEHLRACKYEEEHLNELCEAVKALEEADKGHDYSLVEQAHHRIIRAARRIVSTQKNQTNAVEKSKRPIPTMPTPPVEESATHTTLMTNRMSFVAAVGVLVFHLSWMVLLLGTGWAFYFGVVSAISVFLVVWFGYLGVTEGWGNRGL